MDKTTFFMHSKRFIQYLNHEKRRSPDTLAAYRKDLDQFEEYLLSVYSIEQVAEISHHHIRSWVVELLAAGYAISSIRRKLSSLKSYFKFLEREGHLVRNPMLKVRIPKDKKPLPAYLKEKELERLLDDIQWPEDFAGQRDRLLLEILYQTGLRRSELIRLRESDVDRSMLCLRILGKGGKERIIPFSRSLLELIDQYLVLRRNAFDQVDDFLLLTNQGVRMYPKFVYNTVRKYLSMVTALEQRSPHVLRHSFATHLSNQGADLNAIKELLGHSSLAATQIYTHNSIERLKDIYQQAHPKGSEE